MSTATPVLASGLIFNQYEFKRAVGMALWLTRSLTDCLAGRVRSSSLTEQPTRVREAASKHTTMAVHTKASG
jgi:hypothetical protein